MKAGIPVWDGLSCGALGGWWWDVAPCWPEWNACKMREGSEVLDFGCFLEFGEFGFEAC